MARFRTTIDSRLSAEDACARMAAFERVLEWDETIVEAHGLTDGETGVGSRFRVVSRFGGRDVELVYEVVAFEPPRTLVLVARNPSFEARDTVVVEPAGDGSRVTYEAVLELSGWRRAFEVIVQRMFTSLGRKAEAGLRRFLNP
jgi:hypothetical protein